MNFVLFLFVVGSCHAMQIDRGSDKFDEVRFQPDFLDKTLLIKEFFSNQKPLVIATPQGFGRTTNLDMIKLFFNADTNKTYGEEVFQNTSIFKDVNLMSQMGNHSVLYCSLKADRLINGYDSMVKAYQSILFQSYGMYPYLARSKKITRFDKKRLTFYIGKKKYLTMTPTQIVTGIHFLSKLLYQHHEREVMLLIDDYDSIILDSLFTNSLDHEAVLGFHNALLSSVIHMNPFISKILIAGTSCTCFKPLLHFEHLQCLELLEDDKFSPFFGITESEIDELLERKEYIERKSKKNEIKEWYGGYTSFDLKRCVYNTRSTLSFLKSGNLKSYWSSSRAANTIKYLLIEPVVQQLLNDSVQYKTIKMLNIESINTTDMKGLKSFTENELWDKQYADLFLQLLMEKGYFTYGDARGDKKSVIKVPNKEICQVLEQIKFNFLADPIELLDRLKEAVHQASFAEVTEKVEVDLLNKFNNK